MKVIKISSRTNFVRHWLRWYQVPSTGKNWVRLDTKPKNFPVPRPIKTPLPADDEKLAKHIGLTD